MNAKQVYGFTLCVKNYCSNETAKKDSVMSFVLSNLDTSEEKYLSIENFYQYMGDSFQDIRGLERAYIRRRLKKINSLRQKILKKYYSNNNYILKKLEINPELMVEELDDLRELSGYVSKFKKQANEDYYTINLITQN